MRRFCVLALALLTACATTPGFVARSEADINKALNDLADTATADLQTALNLTPASDIEARTCWSGLQPIVAELQAARVAQGGNLIPQVKGVFSSFQVARNTVRGVLGVGQTTSNQPTLLARINVACGPLRDSAAVDIVKLDLKIAGDISAASTGVGALPATLKAFNALKVLLPMPIPL